MRLGLESMGSAGYCGDVAFLFGTVVRALPERLIGDKASPWH